MSRNPFVPQQFAIAYIFKIFIQEGIFVLCTLYIVYIRTEYLLDKIK